jgi:hypothetical protein
VTSIVINIATDLKTSFLAWLAVAVATATLGVVTWASQLVGSSRPVRRSLVVAGATGLVLAVVFGIVASVLTLASESDTAEVVNQGRQSQGPVLPASSGTPALPTMTAVEERSSTVTKNRVVQNVASYLLVSASGLCPTSDKIDLDTAHSGYGGQPQVGDILEECRVEGGLAELILERDEIHTPKNSQLLYLLDANKAVDQEICRAAVRQVERLKSRISLSELHIGDHLCVMTDRQNFAQVTIVNLVRGIEAEMTIRFTTWA